MANEHDQAHFLALLKKRRAVIKATITRHKNYVFGVRRPIEPETRAQLIQRKVSMEKCLDDYTSIQNEIEVAEESSESDERGIFEENYYEIHSKMMILIGSCDSNLPSVSQVDGFGTVAQSRNSQCMTARLPKLSLPSFSGNYEDWLPFFNVFNSVIHENNSLPGTQKFQYLQTCLTGRAAEVVQSLELSDDNYLIAWSLLKERYDNKRVIVQTHIKELLELPKLVRENVNDLRLMVDSVRKHTRALKSLDRQVDTWDDMLVFILTSKLDARTNRDWQSALEGSDLPTLDQLLEFVTRRFQALEISSNHDVLHINPNKHKVHDSRKFHTSTNIAVVGNKCPYCQSEHSIHQCREFLKLPVPVRVKEMRNRKLCLNCIRTNTHHSGSCRSGNCRICGSKHNTLLHLPRNQETADTTKGQVLANTTLAQPDKPSAVVTYSSIAEGYKMLSTALVYAIDREDQKRICRVLLDPGSQAHLMSRSYLKTLGLTTERSNISISGVNQITTMANETTQVRLQSRLNSYTVDLKCIVTDVITERLPSISFKRSDFEIPSNLQLADPEFFVSSEVDILIGVDTFWELICVGRINASPRHPILQKTHLGWIVAGQSLSGTDESRHVKSFLISTINKQDSLDITRFWELEDVPNTSKLPTLNDKVCEDHFLRTVERDGSGRFIIQLPIKTNILNKLGESKYMALRRFYNLEKRLNRDIKLKTEYKRFLDEYLALGHMEEVDALESQPSTPTYYLPHHCVIKLNSETTKLRVVFDASAKSTSGYSLNEALFVGPVIQDDLVSILIRFRLHKYVFTSDISKMYRQIKLHRDQVDLHRILWRDSMEDEVKTFRLLTLTYGTATASFIATRCIKHLAQEGTKDYPSGSTILQRDMYMDDILTGSDSLDETKSIMREIKCLLEKGCFPLSKWSANEASLLGTEQPNDRVIDFKCRDEVETRVLGVVWNAKQDYFSFKIDIKHMSDRVTKRTVLSDTAKIFDPLGLLGPVILIPKLIVQTLWQLKLHWDSSLPMSLHNDWINFKRELPSLNQLNIARCVRILAGSQDFELHGFCDASERAYGACVYVRTQNRSEGLFNVNLLCSKSRVAPLKALSLPRLELCAAALLAALIERVKDALHVGGKRLVLWSDSTIVLNWLTSPSRNWTAFVSNRVGEIQRVTNIECWRHVRSQDNPADVLSRGSCPEKILNDSLWWHGPEWLKKSDIHWPEQVIPQVGELPEARKTILITTSTAPSEIDRLIEKFSNVNKMCRIVAYCMKFANKLRKRDVDSINQLRPIDVQEGLLIICRHVQAITFQHELKTLRRGEALDTRSKLLSLDPFVDSDGTLRVGGRLKQSNRPYHVKHPILLPKNHIFTRLIIRQEHVRNLHSGLQLTIASVRQRFWPISIRSTARKILRECVTCFKAKPVASETIMGQLPTDRVKLSRPFIHCGVDYAGPFMIRDGARRNARSRKAWLAVFVCFSTKAVHLEVVGDMTTSSFIGALKRFIARRGRVTAIYSDNGKNFVGAQNELKEFYKFVSQTPNQKEILDFVTEAQISWNFIPPGAPHFGGLWEAAVKSAKSHLKRIMGCESFSFEEMQTVFCQIEAVLNSRPLNPLSEDPNDYEALTPGHFLIGEAINSFPCPDLQLINENRLSRWQRIERLRQCFWQRWHVEYLNNLQERHKWKLNKGSPLKIGQLVLIKQSGLAPLQWLMGRVQELHVGSDSVARSATVKTEKCVLTRPITKLCVLPIEEECKSKNVVPLKEE